MKPGQETIRYEVITHEADDGSGDLILPIPPQVMKELGWKEGDNLDIGIDDAGKIILKKADK